jgi:hypothetical protein
LLIFLNHIKKILKHLDLWDQKARLPPKANASPIYVFPTYDEQPSPSTDDYIRDPDTPCRGLFLKPHSGSQASYAQNPGFLANL